ncbi:hypothetical protein BJX63DRAFT_420746 [Aspergillus granulosus]|uniref:Uncharacterized protein n=1 Tax=Aspergillus granulosus TaxID=176169 RepID=A0ABR4HGN0_9EURO
MSGNYDYPPASRRAVRGSRPSDRSRHPNGNRLQHLRDLLNSERNRDSSARALETLNQELEEFRSERARDRYTFDQTRAFVDQQIRELQSGGPSRGGHAHGVRSDLVYTALQRLQDLDVAIMNHDPSPSDVSRPAGRAPRFRAVRGGDRPGRRRHRDSILDQPVPHLDSPSTMPLDPGQDQGDRWRVKRRKLDSDDNREGLQSLRYGQYGQVVPGTLKMELAGCDGGTYEPEGDSSWPENILRNDSSVYCTKSDRCNLILKHRGETPFCLKKLVIKAPKSGYDAPIQAGMVFVSMSSDELLARTAQYQIQYSGSHSRHRGHRRSGMQPSQEYLNSYRTPLQALDREALAAFETTSESDTDASEPTRRTPSHETDLPGEFQVTMEYDERPESDEYERLGTDFSLGQNSQMTRLEQMAALYPLNDDFLCSETEDTSEDDDTSESNSFNSRRRDLQRQVRAMRRQYAMEQDEAPRSRHIPNTIQPVPPNAPLAPRPRPSSRPRNVELMRPLARFFIERPKSSVSLKFDPPPSGRYILIKLWSPYNAGNIDIQSVIAHGYAGPRFFPAAGLR